MADMKKHNLSLAPELAAPSSMGATSGCVNAASAAELATFLESNWGENGCTLPSPYSRCLGYYEYHRTAGTHSPDAQQKNTLLIKNGVRKGRRWLNAFRKHAPGFADMEQELCTFLEKDGKRRTLKWAHALRQDQYTLGASVFVRQHARTRMLELPTGIWTWRPADLRMCVLWWAGPT